MASARFLLTGSDFENDGNAGSLAVTAVAIFVLLFALEHLTYVLAGQIFAHDPRIRNPQALKKLCRSFNEFLSMMFMVWLGYESFVETGRFSPFVHGVGIQNLFLFSGKAQRLILFHATYEVKNFIKSFMDSDGAVYLLHHAVTFFCAFCALNPFLHHYAAFYLGISEFSTGLLCLYLCFSDENGLKARYPQTTSMLGILFAINFVIFRIVLWFFFSYHFWIDLIALYTTDQIHSYSAFGVYAVGNTGLTMLQLMWLGEIISAVVYPPVDHGSDTTNQSSSVEKKISQKKVKQKMK